MRGVTRVFWGMLLVVLMATGVSAQDSGLIAPNIFLRGLQTPQGVRYSATFVKPSDEATLRNVSVEITLPLNADFREMLLSRQIEFDVIRRSPQGQLTLIWQMSRVASDRALDAFAFTVAQPLADPIEFYMQWQDEAGTLHVENFYERPSLIDATQTEQTFRIAQAGAQTLGSTGIQIIPPAEALPLSLSARVLSQDFNPPPEYGDLWWCSLLALDGLPVGATALVIVPLRRPVAPFTALAMFQQQPDGSWQALESQAIVTADGQFALYQHPGGIIATGGPEEIKQEALPVEQAVIIEVPTVPDPPPVIPVELPAEAPQSPVEASPAPIEPSPVPVEPTALPIEPQSPAEAPTTAPITDGSSNTLIISENPSPVPVEPTAIPIQPTAVLQDASSNTVIVGKKPTSAPGVVILPTLAPFVATSTTVVSTSTLLPFISPVPSATNNKAQGVTIVSSAGTPASPEIIVTGKASGVTSSSPTPFASTPAPITDGSSNTILIGERTTTPNTQFGDGSVRVIGTGTLLPTFGPAPTLPSIPDGSSNTVLVGESTRTPNTQFGDGSVRVVGTGTLLPTLAPAPTLASIPDGSSNTVLVGESTRTPNTQFGDGSVRVIGTGTLLPTLASVPDGSSNTVLIGEATPTPSGQFTDGTSNTVLIGERTPTAQFSDGTVRFITGTPLPFISPVPSATRNKTEGVIIVGNPSTPQPPGIIVTGKASGVTSSSPTPTLIPLGDGVVRTLAPITDGSSNTILIGERTPTPTLVQDGIVRTLPPLPSSTPRPAATLAPTVTRTPAPTPTTINLGPGVIINPPVLPSTILPFGGGGSRVEITGVTNTKMTQCSAGGISCAVVVRVTGKGAR